MKKETRNLRPFFYQGAIIIDDTIDESGRMLVKDGYYKEELKEAITHNQANEIMSEFLQEESEHFQELERRDKVARLTHKEIARIKANDEYLGTQQNVENESTIFETFLAEGLVTQNWFDDRLRYTKIELLEELLKEYKEFQL